MKHFIITWSCTNSAARTMADLAAFSVCCSAASHSSGLADRVWKEDNQIIWLNRFAASHLYMPGWSGKNSRVASTCKNVNVLRVPHRILAFNVHTIWLHVFFLVLLRPCSLKCPLIIILMTSALITTQSQYITDCFHTWIAFPLRGSESSTSSMTGFSLIIESCCRWKTSSCLNSSCVLASRSFCLKEISENIVENVLPSSIAVLVLFWERLITKLITFCWISSFILICHHL